MRPTWIVVGLVLGIGTIAYWKLRQQADETPPPEAAPSPAAPAGRPSAPVLLKGEARGEEPAALAPATAAETRARALLQEVVRRFITRLNLGLGSAVSVLIFLCVVLIAALYLKGFGIDLARREKN